ncbi:hypothetical protein BU24DRAFT_252946 [Aaosphaeria arxii CBS 175.79]|uniref:TM7S3/TM198-like domain-containing protein n=1 Tax=Aaosphaeria arxii CBS 175.79 TaxID=1450172 RepID=A0A6A5XH19_9PLEO|nr:uncharacterized protein BU24DRAFT_252946 [Aaosphaeria arxii CBS 175.79]KAF2012488.1 hypothetical protein BU24DRAFT_252946 [Aaosphaeria arxii CBS 175.79]
MRSYSYLIIALALLLCIDFTAAIPQSLVVRQDERSSERPESSTRPRNEATRSLSTATQSVESSVTRSQSGRSSQTPNSSGASSSSPASSTSATQSPTPTVLENSSPTSTEDPQPKDPLPIHPKITPALGIAGVILLLSGIAYTIIGIKNKWLYVFASAAYLSSLAVTVLIIYLMTPPVSNAIQGGFFVAAFFTGILFGGLSLIFPDMTEGLGCLLGGFCLSMWFLTVKENGLITSQTGRSIFIGVMSAAGFSLSFSHYTRQYGLIVCISFAGATITMLGVDCLSQAGWKEFWLYLWNLNKDTFPLETNTYPLTRGIRAELAGVVIITLLGIVSQMRLWKVVRQHREKSAKKRFDKERESRRQQEEEVGRNVQESSPRSQQTPWNPYGVERKNPQDSVMGSSSNGSIRKRSASVREQELSGSEMVDMEPLPRKQINNGVGRGMSTYGSKDTPTSTTVTVSVLRDDDGIQAIDAQGRPISSRMPTSETGFNGSGTSANSSSPSIELPGKERAQLRASVPPPPVVIPLPFSVPEGDVQSIDGDNSSVSAEPESVHGSATGRSRFSKRLSGGSILKRLSTITAEVNDGEALIVPHIEDDRASSVAATLDDDVLSLPDLSPPQSPTGFVEEKDQIADVDTPGEHERSVNGHDDAVQSKRSSAQQERQHSEGQVSPTVDGPSSETEVHLKTEAPYAAVASKENTDETTPSKNTVRQSLTVSTDPKVEQDTSKSTSPLGPRSPTNSTGSDSAKDSAPVQQAKSVQSKTPSLKSQPVQLSKDVLPERLSRVALSYRTNEWAKHLALADHPELETLSDVEASTKEESVEKPVPVSDEIAGIEPAVSKRTSKRVSSDSSVYRPGLGRAESSASRIQVQYANNNMPSLSRNPSAISPGGRMLSRNNSSSTQQTDFRSASSPYLVPSPDPTAPDRFNVVPSPSPAPGTLMSKRESLIKNRFSSQSFQNPASPISPGLSVGVAPADMTLAQRKQLIQQQQQQQQQQVNAPHRRPPSTSQKWAQNTRLSMQDNEQMGGFNSHQPVRRASGNGVDQSRREDMLANWRESIRQQHITNTTNSGAATPVMAAGPAISEAQMMALMNEQRALALREQQEAVAAQQLQSQRQNMMRTGTMLDAHREAMRKMQAAANRSAS